MVQTYANHRHLPWSYLICGLVLLASAAYLLDTTPQSVHTAERRELGKGLEGSPREPGTMTLSSLLTRAAAYGLELEVHVRARR